MHMLYGASKWCSEGQQVSWTSLWSSPHLHNNHAREEFGSGRKQIRINDTFVKIYANKAWEFASMALMPFAIHLPRAFIWMAFLFARIFVERESLTIMHSREGSWEKGLMQPFSNMLPVYKYFSHSVREEKQHDSDNSTWETESNKWKDSK